MLLKPARINRQVGLADWVEKSTNYTAVDGDRIICAAALTITLPASEALGQDVWVMKRVVGAVTIDRNANQLNGGAVNLAVTNRWETCHLVSLGAGNGWAGNNIA